MDQDALDEYIARNETLQNEMGAITTNLAMFEAEREAME